VDPVISLHCDDEMQSLAAIEEVSMIKMISHYKLAAWDPSSLPRVLPDVVGWPGRTSNSYRPRVCYRHILVWHGAMKIAGK
jgi:hypothetical protein